MKYTIGDNAVEYEVLSSTSFSAERFDLIFSVGGAERVLHISKLQLVDGKMTTAVNVLKEFCSSLAGECILYDLQGGNSGTSVAMRYVLQEVGFVSTKRFIDEKDCTLFMYRNASTFTIYQRLEDEAFSFVLDEMLRDDSTDRLELLLSRIGKSSLLKLKEVTASMASDTTVKKMEI